MATSVSEVVRRLLPEGTRGAGRASWSQCPIWPPDVFAVAATLVRLSGCYSRPMFSSGFAKGYRFDDAYRARVIRAGANWSSEGTPGRDVTRLWKRLAIDAAAADISATGSAADDWQQVAMELLAIADEASVEIGFSTSTDLPFPWLLRVEHARIASAAKGRKWPLPAQLPHVPGSICREVPPRQACVLPKTMTAQLGCTLRSLTHNLALLPPSGVVASSWLFGEDAHTTQSEPLNVLLVPFPYRIDGTCFEGREQPGNDDARLAYHFFSVKQQWLTKGGRPVTAAEITRDLLMPLVKAARKEAGKVHAIVMPEGALTDKLAAGVARLLAKQPDIELFISGALAHGAGHAPENHAHTFCFGKKGMLTNWYQKKSHRWALDESQIQRYHLGHILKPKRCIWWEMIDIERRKCVFYVVRRGACLSVTICEDLARFDPSHPVLQAVGPNLLIALLMDGPQLKGRWPARYATVFADDPGSAVLTLTSIGMVRRSAMPGTKEPREIALWKQPGGEATELQLPPGDHALLLTLSMHQDEQFTLDGRSDGNLTRRFELSGARGIKSDAKQRWFE